MKAWMRHLMVHLVTVVTAVIGVLVAVSVILGLCVACGVEIFGERAFAAEIPSITEPCGMSTEELTAVLKYSLKPYAEDFLRAEEDYQVNACFLASISALESGWGRKCFRKNNIFGFGQREFETVTKCIDYVAWFLRKNYLNENGRYYNGATIEGVSVRYCDEEWARLVEDIYYNFYK